jgi:hypothetical protein
MGSRVYGRLTTFLIPLIGYLFTDCHITDVTKPLSAVRQSRALVVAVVSQTLLTLSDEIVESYMYCWVSLE